jgi:hypothetical protein
MSNVKRSMFNHWTFDFQHLTFDTKALFQVWGANESLSRVAALLPVLLLGKLVISAGWHSAFPCVFLEIAGPVGDSFKKEKSLVCSTHFRGVDVRSG